MSKLIAFGWYGGKFSHLDWLLPLLPQTKHYCEPFGGSAAILINREPSEVETYNDIDGEVVNFFKVLREQKDELIEEIGLTPFSREEFGKAISEPTKNFTNLERARRFYIRARQVRTGLAQKASNGRCTPRCLNSCGAWQERPISLTYGNGMMSPLTTQNGTSTVTSPLRWSWARSLTVALPNATSSPQST